MSNEQMAQSILQFTGGKGNIRMVSNCMTRVRLEVNDLSVVQIDQIKALKGVFGVHVDAQVQVIVGPGTAAKVAACLQELLGDAHKAAGQADKETAQEIAARNKQVIKSRQKVSKGKLFLKTIYAGGLLLSYAAGFVLTYFFGVPKEAEQPAETLEELEMQ